MDAGVLWSGLWPRHRSLVDCDVLIMLSRLASPAPLPRLASEADLFGQIAARLGVVRSNHRIVGPEVPFGTVFVGRHPMLGREMTLQHFHLPAAVEAADGVLLDRAADRDRWG